MTPWVLFESNGVRFVAYQQQFASITGPEPGITILCECASGEALFHEACVYHPQSRSIFVTSNQLPRNESSPYEATSNKRVKLSRIYDKHDRVPAFVEDVQFRGIDGAMLNGGVNFGRDSLLLCAQGSRNKEDLSGIISLRVFSSPEQGTKQCPTTLVSSFYGLPFNSVNDVVVHPVDGSIWFTDPCYGYHQGIRQPPLLPDQVYRYHPSTGSLRAMSDNFSRPNGLCFSPDLSTLYVTDTGCIHGSAHIPMDFRGPSHIYAFDINYSGCDNNHGPFLTNRRTFAFAPGRCPDGIKCDLDGNVYAGCGDGIEVWNACGDPLGTIEIPGGVANFCFGADGIIYACNETRLLKITLSTCVKGALLGI